MRLHAQECGTFGILLDVVLCHSGISVGELFAVGAGHEVVHISVGQRHSFVDIAVHFHTLAAERRQHVGTVFCAIGTVKTIGIGCPLVAHAHIDGGGCRLVHVGLSVMVAHHVDELARVTLNFVVTRSGLRVQAEAEHCNERQSQNQM